MKLESGSGLWMVIALGMAVARARAETGIGADETAGPTGQVRVGCALSCNPI